MSRGALGSTTYFIADQCNEGCSIGSLALSGRIGESQMVWLKALQDRLSYTSLILGNIRSVKLLGLETRTIVELCRLREMELTIYLKFRKLLVWSVGLCKCDTLQPGNTSSQPAHSRSHHDPRTCGHLSRVQHPSSGEQQYNPSHEPSIHVSGRAGSARCAVGVLHTGCAKSLGSSRLLQTHPGFPGFSGS